MRRLGALFAWFWLGAASAQEIEAGALMHDIAIGTVHKEGGVDFNGEFLFASPEFLKVLWSPRPAIGATINSDGNTDQAIVALVWTLIGSSRGEPGLYLDVGAGGEANDGRIPLDNRHHEALGSHLLFHEEAELGWQFEANWSIGLYLDHVSNAGLAFPNEGLNDLGMRLGYHF